MPHEKPHLRLIKSDDQPRKNNKRKNWRARFARVAREILHAPETRHAALANTVITAAAYAVTGNIEHSLTTGVISGFLTTGLGVGLNPSQIRNLPTVITGATVIAGCVFGAGVADNLINQQRQNADPLPNMIANKELGPKTFITASPLARNQIDITTVIGKPERPVASDLIAPGNECVRYWVVRHNNQTPDEGGNPELRQIDFTQKPTAQIGDCATVDHQRSQLLERKLGPVAHNLPLLSVTP